MLLHNNSLFTAAAAGKLPMRYSPRRFVCVFSKAFFHSLARLLCVYVYIYKRTLYARVIIHSGKHLFPWRELLAVLRPATMIFFFFFFCCQQTAAAVSLYIERATVLFRRTRSLGIILSRLHSALILLCFIFLSVLYTSRNV